MGDWLLGLEERGCLVLEELLKRMDTSKLFTLAIDSACSDSRVLALYQFQSGSYRTLEHSAFICRQYGVLYIVSSDTQSYLIANREEATETIEILLSSIVFRTQRALSP